MLTELYAVIVEPSPRSDGAVSGRLVCLTNDLGKAERSAELRRAHRGRLCVVIAVAELSDDLATATGTPPAPRRQ